MKNRGFEVYKNAENNIPLIALPQRQTKWSAGYDIRSNETVMIPPNQKRTVRTGITAYMNDDEFLDLRIRSSLAFNHHLTLQNDAGVIDADYYGKEIKVMIRNEGNLDFYMYAGDRIAQGIFTKYLLTDDDNPKDTERKGGFGFTGKK